MNWYLASILTYAFILIAIGWFIGRHVTDASNFFVGNRKFSWKMLFVILIAANIGAGSTVGVTGLAYRHGLSAWWWIACSAFGSLILAYVVGPRVWRIAKKYNLYTMGDYLDLRYAKFFRGVISGMMALGTLALFSGQLIGIAWILDVVANVDKPLGTFIGAMVVTIYFAAGGVLSAAIVNILEVIVILAGFCLAAPFALQAVGGWSGMEAQIALNFADAVKTNNYFAWDGIGLSSIIGYFFVLTPAFCISPGLIGKIYSAESERAVKLGTMLNALVQFAFAFLPVIIGMCAYAAFPDLKNPELALPLAMKELMPFGVAAFALAAIFAAEVSTADAVLYMLSSSIAKDLYKTFLKPEITDKELLSFSRKVTVAAGVAGVLLALWMPNIITALQIFYSLMTVSIAAPFLIGLFAERASTNGAVLAAVTGVVTMLGFQFLNNGQGLWLFNPATLGILASTSIMFLSLYILPGEKNHL
ncbi:MAG TPA: sodium:solute symporter family protein [Candidatus Avacidaminococcus intestinavium]|uniref:Sodium:solute symporter family protein n=1 Tax=Candidatus Avacidaminococcus intestinavium TaxID=2840684 RepID=A0A9D1MQF1_9FIRM|nr:sodium:solute symporter family protein [Candidatus Avacidaminococcus intestinavium]